MARGSLYSTAAWQKTRRAILARDGHICQLRGPKCTGIATTVHHLLPSSQYPHLFFDASNLAAACRHCNYSGGREIQLANRTDRQLLNHYEQIIERQQAEIEELRRQLEELDAAQAASHPGHPLTRRPSSRPAGPEPARANHMCVWESARVESEEAP